MKTETEKSKPRPCKHPHLRQAHLTWRELVEMRKRHVLRIGAIERGDCNMDAQYERDWLEATKLDHWIADSLKEMKNYGRAVGPIWDWLTAIRGLGEGSLAAQLLSEIDDIGRFATISKLWRFAGYAVINGERERNMPGEKSHYNRRLKSVCYLVCDQFIRQQTPGYVELYYEEKERQNRLHPELKPIIIHRRAMRKTVKIFLQHLWLTWRTAEGLPVSEPYVHAVMGHTHYIEPLQMTN